MALKSEVVTKEDLLAEVSRLQQVVTELQEQLAARDALLSGTGQEGFLVTTPNSRYNGFTAGVEFRNGRAFIPGQDEDSEYLARRLSSEFNYAVRRMSAEDYRRLTAGGK